MDVMELDAEIQRVQRELNRTIRQRRDDLKAQEHLTRVAEQLRAKAQSTNAIPEKTMGEISKKLAQVHVGERFKQNYYNQVKNILFGAPYANAAEHMWEALREAQQKSLDCEELAKRAQQAILRLQEKLENLKAERERLQAGGGFR